MTSSVNESTLTGLEYMQAVVAGKIPMPPMAETIPMRCTAADYGSIHFSARADARHLNRAGNVHGGFTATILDSVTSCALRTTLEAGVGFVTIELNVKLMKPVPRDTDLVAEGKIVNVSRRLGVAEARLMDDQGTLCAHGIATFMLSRPALRGDD
ncbi:MAG TPA: PaaI family thioesterase [Steroidobacteraceae bacterium]|nr:PaaI family thioesterase [Steroidobacteraceae bacterium]